MSAIEDIAAERRRQVEIEGWAPEHDDLHDRGDLARAAACYALSSRSVRYHPAAAIAGGRESADWVTPEVSAWPWDGKWWKPANRRRDLIKAAALIVAEIERLDRAATQDSITPEPMGE